MKTQKDRYSLSSLEKLKEKTNTQSEYQRPEVWKRAQKQLLIDSIMRGYDIPKIYVKQEDSSSQYEFEVIDGQQRLTTIWSFFDGDFGLPKDAEPINGIKCASQTYHELDKTLQAHFNDYKIDLVIVTDAEQNMERDEIGDLFLRLQNGTPLNSQEKRNAMPGQMRDFVKELAGHDFFKESCYIKNARYNHDQLAAQLTLLEISDGPVNINSSELDKMYKSRKDFDGKSKIARQVKNTLNYLHLVFPRETPELITHNVVTLYCMVSKLLKSYVCDDAIKELLFEWFLKFEDEREKNDALDDSNSAKNTILQGYTIATGNSSDKQGNIEKRLSLVQERFFLYYPDILKKDDNRLFSHEQRLAIFRRDKAKCQICHKDLDWSNDYEADHIKPHSQGGMTIVSNGQATCKSCNGAKSDKQ